MNRPIVRYPLAIASIMLVVHIILISIASFISWHNWFLSSPGDWSESLRVLWLISQVVVLSGVFFGEEIFDFIGDLLS